MRKKVAVEEWLTTELATKLLGIGRRELIRKAAKYPLQLRHRSQTIQGTVHTVYHAGDLRAVQERTRLGIDLAVVEKQIQSGQTPAIANLALRGENGAVAVREASYPVQVPENASTLVLEALAGVLAQLPDMFPPPRTEPKRWLSIREAAAYLAMPRSWIRSMIAITALPYVDVGRETRQRIRIRRRDLDAL